MDKEQEQVQVLGFIDILIKSIKIILLHPKLFSKIALALILPFNFLILASFVFIKLMSAETYNNSSTSTEDDFNLFSSKLIIYFCLGTICIIAIQPIFSFSIAAVIYSTGCIYTGKDITFQKALTVALKVGGRQAIIMAKYPFTLYVYEFVITFGILASNFGIIFGFSSTSSDNVQFKTWILKIFIVILVVSGEIYMIICMQLANVITVIEDINGSEAMERSKQLMKGNYRLAIAISLVLFICSTPIFVLAQQLVGIKSNIGVGPKILYGITSMVLNPLIIVYCWVAPTMLYFVCKTYHGETIDISSFDDCVDASKLNGDYVALERQGDEKIDKLDV